MAPRARFWLIAFLTGFGGLLAQALVARRAQLWIGGTAQAASAVLATFLLGLGLGSLWAARRPPSLAQAAARYALVAALLPLSVPVWELVAVPQHGGWNQGRVAPAVLLVLGAGLPAVLMGAAWPALFAYVPAAGVNAANLFGAMAGAWLAGNLIVPELGYRAGLCLAAAVEAVAAGLLMLGAGRAPAPAQAPAPTPAAARPPELVALVLAGAATLGFEVLLLRRLPFFLEGFTPTFSAVLAAFLLALALGSGAVAPLLRRLAGRHACAAAALGAALSIACVPLLLETLRPHPTRWGSGSELGQAWSLLAQALVYAGPACLGLGAFLPLALQRLGGDRPRAAARALLALSVGEAAGALLVNHAVLPWCGADPYRLGFLPVALCAAGAGALVLPAGILWRLLALLLAAPVFLASARAPLQDSRYVSGERLERREILDHATDDTTTATAVWDKAEHQLLLYTDEFQAAATGRQSAYMRTLGLLPFLLGAPRGKVAVLALGTGTTANTVLAAEPNGPVHLVEVSRAVLVLQHRFAEPAGDLRATLSDPRVTLHVADGRRFLLTRAAAEFDVITMEPLLPYAPGTVPLYTEEFYRIARSRLAPEGWFLQWIPAHAMPERFFRALVGSFAAVFPNGSLWLFQNSVLLAGSPQAELPAPERLPQAFAALAPAARELWRAGLCHQDDLGVAFVTRELELLAADAPPLRDDRPWLERLGFWSQPMRDGFLYHNLRLLLGAAERDQTAGGYSEPRWRGPRLERLRARLLAAGPREQRTRLLADAETLLAGACRALPESLLLHRERALVRAQVLVERAGELAAAGRRAEAEGLLARAVEDWPEWNVPWQRLAELLPQGAEYQAQQERLAQSVLTLQAPPGDAALDAALVGTTPVSRWPAWLAIRPWRATERVAALLQDAGTTDPVRVARLVAGRLDPWLLGRLCEWAQRQGVAVRARFLVERVGGRPVLPVDRALPTVFAAAVGASDPALRVQLAQTGLAGRKDPASVEALLVLFLDPELPVRQAAAINLARTNLVPFTLDPEAAPDERAAQAERFRAAVR